MRVQRTIRILRVALPIAGAAFILLLVLTWHRGTPHKDKSTTTPVTSSIRPGEQPAVESRTFHDVQTVGGRVVSRISAARVVSFKSGWNTLEGVSLTIYRPNNLTYELVCPQAEFNSETKESNAKGGVKVNSSDGVEIITAEIYFNGSHLTNHIPVQFKIDRWTGNAGALDLDVQAESLHLSDKLTAQMQPATPDEAAMTIAANDGVFLRKENIVNFTANVVMTRDADRIVADHMAAKLAADRKTLTDLHGEGHVDITMADGSNLLASAPAKGTEQGRKEITCDRFWSELGGDGKISAIDAAGDAGPAHAVLEGPPKRDLVAKTIRVALANKVVTDVRADTQVVMKEFGDIPRDLTAEHVLVYFDPNAHKPTSAVIDGNFHYHDPRNDARAARANYDITGDRVVLIAQPGWDPVVVSDGNILKAKTIEFSPHAQTARATGSVIAQLVSKPNTTPGASADTTNVFPANKPVFVNSDLLTMQQAKKIAIFTGHVKAWQETNTVFANEMQVTGNGDQITARGEVRTILYNTGSEKTPRTTPIRSSSNDLAAFKAERRIDLLGNVTIDDDQNHMEGQKASFFTDVHNHIERVEAEQKIVLVQPALQRKGTGDKLTYLVPKHMIYLSGSPAHISDPSGNVSGQNVAIDTQRNRVDIVSPTDATKGTYKNPPKP